MAEADVTYANANFIRQRSKVCAKCAAHVQQAGQSTGSKVTRERVVLLVLIAILVATIIALAVKINSTRKMCTSSTPRGPPSPEVKNETCLKCEAGWELLGGKCYKFNSNKSSWTESRRSCKDLGGDLVKIDSREEQMFLEEKLRQINQSIDPEDNSFWIGLTDSETEGRWLWVDGSPLNQSLSFWGPEQPDASGGGESSQVDCVRVMKTENSDGFLWFDRYCNDSLRSVCEKAAETQPCLCV